MELIAIFERMTTKLPAQRFQTAKEVAEKTAGVAPRVGRRAGILAHLRADGRRHALQAAGFRPAKAGTRRRRQAHLVGERGPGIGGAGRRAAEPVRQGRIVWRGAKAEPRRRPKTGRRSTGSSGSAIPAARQPGTESKRPANVRADVLAELLPDGFISSPSSSGPLMTLPPEEEYCRLRPANVPASVELRPGLLKSPWFWTAVIWVTAFLLALWLIFR